MTEPTGPAEPAESEEPAESTAYETIRVERDGRVGWITLDRPAALNALDSTLVTELADAADAFDADEGIGCIVLTGSERAFAAGADIKQMEQLSSREMAMASPFAALERFARVRTPIVGAVSGFALGGGCELAMMCDILIAAETAVFGQPEITLGVIPGLGGTQRLTRRVGLAKAMDLVLTGRRMPADEAERAGLVSRVVPAERLRETAAEVAASVAAASLPVAYAAKAAVRVAEETSLSEGLRYEQQVFASLFALDDQKEGMAAFREKRAPQFRHR